MAAAIKGEELHVFTGSTMVNQYMGDFFARAFPFLFKDGAVAMPDMPGQGAGKRRERKVDLEEWTEIFSLRPEHQFGADWAFSYVPCFDSCSTWAVPRRFRGCGKWKGVRRSRQYM